MASIRASRNRQAHRNQLEPLEVPLMSVNMIKQSTQTENLSLRAEVDTLLVELGVEPASYTGGTLVAKTPITGEVVAHVREVDAAGATSAIERAHAAFLDGDWCRHSSGANSCGCSARSCAPTSARSAAGSMRRQDRVRRPRRGAGDDRHLRLAVGLSRQLYGLTIATERPRHRMTETWHPLGVTGIISAFNFPVAVWSWNAALALVCGTASSGNRRKRPR